LALYPILLPFVSQSSEDRFAICQGLVTLVMRLFCYTGTVAAPCVTVVIKWRDDLQMDGVTFVVVLYLAAIGIFASKY
jgi:energy-converting hydrogenase Eha subunit B